MKYISAITLLLVVGCFDGSRDQDNVDVEIKYCYNIILDNKMETFCFHSFKECDGDRATRHPLPLNNKYTTHCNKQ